VRLAIVLPVHSSRDAVAATRVIIGLLRSYGRTELALSPVARSLPGERHRAEFRQVLFVAMDLELLPGDTMTREDVERMLRAQVERQYARHGIPSVDYDLQIL
jgi:hypothetical protein